MSVLSDEMCCNCDLELTWPSAVGVIAVNSEQHVLFSQTLDTASTMSPSRFLLWVIVNEEVLNKKKSVAAVTRSFLLLLGAKQICGTYVKSVFPANSRV